MRFYTCQSTGKKLLVTGSVDRTVRIWRSSTTDARQFVLAQTLEGHTGSVNAVAVADSTNLVASGAADGSVRLWRISDGGANAELVQSINMKPRFFPMTLSLSRLQTDGKEGPVVLAIAGTTNIVQIFVSENNTTIPGFKICATLWGHEAWVRSLSFTNDKQSKTGDLLLASASQDKYIRLWRLHRGEAVQAAPADETDPMLGGMEPTLTNKAHEFEAAGSKFTITFEALLFGNEDWIYTTAWNPNPKRQQLLSASADNTLTIWEQDSVSGVWVSMERMGEISVQKGSTTATGSTGGFWIGLWSPDGTQVVSLGRTGSWRSWRHDVGADIWVQTLGISGHVRSVNSVQWEPSGGYLLSTSADQTTRLHAQWLRKELGSWHEFARPQIHGYDLNCVDIVGPARFVSGADEKLLRVFNEPKQIAQLLERLSGFQQSTEALPDTAQMPVLGLSNQATGEETPLEDDDESSAQTGNVQASLAESNEPPLEDQLARYTLWPEHEKLYGHGYEISAVAVSHDHTLIATACKASSLDHAVIRLYDTSDWHEIRPPLTAHSLTITSLCFSGDDRYLVSVGRDRQWAVFQRNEQDQSSFSLLQPNPKGHSRMILDASWAPVTDKPVFATAGRDKSVKVWRLEERSFVCQSTISLQSSVTAISFLPAVQDGSFLLAVGEDSGELSIYQVAVDYLEAKHLVTIDKTVSPSKTITELSWRPTTGTNTSKFELAVASEDTSTRIYAISNVFA